MILSANILTQFNSEAMAMSMSKNELEPVSEVKESAKRSPVSAQSR